MWLRSAHNHEARCWLSGKRVLGCLRYAAGDKDATVTVTALNAFGLHKPVDLHTGHSTKIIGALLFFVIYFGIGAIVFT